jgi:KaiC/GvpD/RAD55 family RecA-like ATPase
MDRLPTYIEGFDDVLGGGVPKGSVVLLCGTPGTMKTSLTFSILYHNVKNQGSKALYISLEEGHDDLKGAMTDLGLAGIEDMEMYILDVSKIRLEHKEEETAKNWLDILQTYIDQRVKVNKFDLVAIDSLAGLYSLSHMVNPRRELFHFFGFLKSLPATTFLVSEISHGSDRYGMYDEDFLADGILLVKHFEAGISDMQLRIRCVKMRRAKHEKGYYRLLHNEKGFQVTRVISE